ncbi:MAG: hypothetical protein ACYC3S_05125 [Chloroflexota bacterium]
MRASGLVGATCPQVVLGESPVGAEGKEMHELCVEDQRALPEGRPSSDD